MSDDATYELGARDRKRLAARLAGVGSTSLTIRTPEGDLELPVTAQHAVEQLLADLAAGHRVRVLADDKDLTTQEVAELLGLSRTFVARLIDEGTLAGHRAGTHRRVRAADALAYARRRKLS